LEPIAERLSVGAKGYLRRLNLVVRGILQKVLGYAETIFLVKSDMLSKLSQSEHEAVRHLFAPLDYHLIIRAVIEGASPGVIYVNDRNSPFTAFLCSA
jgi:hypothetical protein